MLRQDGYATATPKLDLYSINGDVSILRRTLNSIPGPKIVVGHSYGGVVVSNATYGRSDVLGLVFTAAFLPDRGDSILTLGIGFRPSGSTQHLVIVGLPARTIIDRAYFPRYFAQDLDAATAAELNRQQRPFNLPIIATPSGPVGWHDLPSWYAVSGEDLMIDPAQERWMAHRAGATTIEFDGASHAAGYTRYATEFVALIEQAAQATTG